MSQSEASVFTCGSSEVYFSWVGSRWCGDYTGARH